MARTDGTHLDDLRDGYRDGQTSDGQSSDGQPPAPPTRPAAAGGAAPLAPLEFLRYCWRQLTSMRTALFLLMLLAVAAVPGSTFPQENNNPSGVATWIADHPTAGPWVERLQGFHVYSSAWFSAIYLLLFISLVGCVLPRARVHLAALRARPPRTPTRLSRLPEHAEAEVAASPEQTLEAARAALRKRRFRLDVHAEAGGGSVAAERGHHRETGNLLFHLSLVGLLLAVAAGSLFSYSGQRLVTVGSGLVGTVGSWDSFSGGVWASADDVPPFSLTLDRMDVAFEAQQTTQIGEPRQFAADVSISDAPGEPVRKETIKVNHPAELDGTQISLSGNGYAPVITYRDGSGAVVKSGPVPFLPQTANYDSTGVVKLPDATDAAGEPVQVGLRGVFLPSATVDASGTPVSGFPDLANPLLIMVAFTGDLGLDDGVAQNVYELDDSRLTQVSDGEGRPFAIRLVPGQSLELPDGLGTVTFDSVERFASFDVRHTPGQREALVFALLAATGLILSLFVPRRRVWVRVRAVDGDPGASRLEVAGLARGNDAGLREEVEGVLAAVQAATAGAAAGSVPVRDDGEREHVDAGTGRTPEEGS
ncbi:cytochrome c biogenesis protein ResB [Kineococcus rubinsiae]|uniref:cytochrome c biogenesis protein ResB n=1 Tax=Kineococcus rubinsiae TaxID=2609562 RepID=UPI00142FE3A7|nr:cytochrome c biogenesis protein ResB [Kineococcus rubinsiae]NIZ92643.1 cytochrome c biogenesis protein ResB [Kineococcus rubinsiae]